jgi:hypothetical protein
VSPREQLGPAFCLGNLPTSSLGVAEPADKTSGILEQLSIADHKPAAAGTGHPGKTVVSAAGDERQGSDYGVALAGDYGGGRVRIG